MGRVQCTSTRDPALNAGSRQTSKHLNPGALDAERKRNHKNRCTRVGEQGHSLHSLVWPALGLQPALYSPNESSSPKHLKKPRIIA